MYQRVLVLTKLTGSDKDRYQDYTDFAAVSSWAEEAVSAVTISPKANLTYAETAQAIKNLLVESKLINK